MSLTTFIAASLEPRRVRMTGRVEAIDATPSVLKLEVRPGELVTVRLEGDGSIEGLYDLFNQTVVIEGTGIFRPSGLLFRIDADAIARATAEDEFFRRLPVASRDQDFTKLARLKPGEASVYARLHGALAGDESDEEFEAGLATLR